MDFVHQALRTRVVARPGAIGELGRELARLGCRRPLLLASDRTAAGPLHRAALEALRDTDYLVAGGIPAHSSLGAVAEVAQAARRHRADALVALGGGSVSDTAKAAALLLAEGGPLERHASRFVPPATVLTPDLVQPKLPILSVPMTASGAEVTPSLGIRTEAGTKLLFWDARLASRVVLLDAAANLETPAPVMLATGMNGLAHCIEGLYSRARSPIASLLALDGIVQFDRALRRVARAPDQIAPRAELLLAAHVSGMVLASARSCLHHAICHVLGATHGVAHGAVNAVVLPHAVRFNLPEACAELGAAARRLGLVAPGGPEHPDNDTDAAAAQALVDWLAGLQHDIGVPTRLRDLGIARESLHGAAEKTLHERGLAMNPRTVTSVHDVASILEAAW